MMSNETLMKLFEAKDAGKMDKYVGCKIVCDEVNPMMRLTQLVKIQRFIDEYDKGTMKGNPKTPLEAGVVLCKESEGCKDNILSDEDQTFYRSLTVVILHMMRWMQVEIMNAVQVCSWFMTEAKEDHDRHLQHITTYCINSRYRGLMIALKAIWDGIWDFIFIISGMSDSEYVKDESRYAV